jgi:hypothetical protein
MHQNKNKKAQKTLYKAEDTYCGKCNGSRGTCQIKGLFFWSACLFVKPTTFQEPLQRRGETARKTAEI